MIVGYDASPASEAALAETAGLFGSWPVLVTVVWEGGHIGATHEEDAGLYEWARRLADHGAALARDCGLDAEGLAVVDDSTPGASLVRLARQRDARALVIGSHGRSRLSELDGHTSWEVIRAAPCPVVVRGPSP